MAVISSTSQHVIGVNVILVVAMVTLLTTIPITALVGTLDGIGIIEAGSRLVLNCTLDIQANGGRTANDVIWHRYPNSLPLNAYTAVTEDLSQLTLSNVTFDDVGRYVCYFSGDRFFEKQQIIVDVGRKPEPAILDCSVPSPDEFFCHWEAGTDTKIETGHKFALWSDNNWQDCPQRSASNTCNVTRIGGPDQNVKVTSTNRLGSSRVDKTFNMHMDVVVNPPRRVQAVRLETETSVRVAWEKPARFPRTGPLAYKIRFRMNDCVLSSSQCWAEEILRQTSSEHLTQMLRDLEPYTTYVVQVAAWYPLSRPENWSAGSKDVAVTTREMAPIETITYLQRDIEPYAANPMYKRNILVYWTGLPPKGQRGRILGYKVLLLAENPQETFQKNSTNQDWFRLHNLERFRGYHIKVAAYNNIGAGPWSVVRVADETTAPNSPDEVRAVALTTTSILVEWVESSQPNGYIHCYILQWGLHNQDRESHTTPNATVFSRVLEDLKPNSHYEVGVKTRNVRGDSEPKFVIEGVWTLGGDEQQNPPLTSTPTQEVLAPLPIDKLQLAVIILALVGLVVTLTAVCLLTWRRVRRVTSVSDANTSVELKYNEKALTRC